MEEKKRRKRRKERVPRADIGVRHPPHPDHFRPETRHESGASVTLDRSLLVLALVVANSLGQAGLSVQSLIPLTEPPWFF